VYRFDDQRALPRVAFGTLVERGLLRPGQTLYFGKKGKITAIVLANGQIRHNGSVGSIHEVGRAIQNAPCNGWEHWHYEDERTGERRTIDTLRQLVRAEGEGKQGKEGTQGTQRTVRTKGTSTRTPRKGPANGHKKT
ncbi:MAG: hypothetical protein ACRDH2_14250, partial [Anaerolineales bacterium]